MKRSQRELLHEPALRRIAEWTTTLMVVEDAVTIGSELYRDYQQWSEEHGREGISRNLWGRWMAEHYPRTVSRGQTAYIGIRPHIQFSEIQAKEA